MMLLGPAIAEHVFSLLNCNSGGDRVSNGCNGLRALVGNRFAPFFKADQLLDVPFIFLAQFWWLIAAWLALIFYVKHRPPEIIARRALEREALKNDPVLRAEHRARWFWRAFRTSAFGLVSFCVLFGVPILGNLSAQWVMSMLGCDASIKLFPFPIAAFSDPSHPSCLDAGGFWAPRLKPYFSTVLGLENVYLLGVGFFPLLAWWLVATIALYFVARFADPKRHQ
jgi:hypothetical protein